MDDIDLRLRIEQTLLRPDATAADVRAFCEEALRHGFVGVCVVPDRVAEAAAILRGRPVALVTTAGFPHGTASPDAKAFEAERGFGRGATDVDFVMHAGRAKDGDWDAVRREFSAMRAAVPEATLKVILETGLLTEDEVRRAAALAVEAGLDFVKTSTGYGPRGATVEDVRLLRSVVGERCRVKASGGIRTRAEALSLLAAGADRIGTSRGVEMVAGEAKAGSGPFGFGIRGSPVLSPAPGYPAPKDSALRGPDASDPGENGTSSKPKPKPKGPDPALAPP